MRTQRRLVNLLAGQPVFNVAKTAGTPTMYLYDEISPWGVMAVDVVKEMAALDGADFSLRINSPGGDVFEGLAILNTLRSYPGKITAYVDGLAASAASFIAMGADEVVMMPNSQLMIHDAWGMCVGNADDMQQMSGELARISNNIADVYKRGGSETDFRALMLAESWFSPQEALDVGLADRVESGKPAQNIAAYDLTVFKNKRASVEVPAEKIDFFSVFERAFKEAGV
jgi:ATP-dependent protease ClpP protease subunit